MRTLPAVGAIRAYGALAQDAASLPAALQRREGLACGGTMAVRWRTAGMLEADHQFRRVNGHLHLPKLLEDHFKTVSAASQNEDQQAA